MKTRKMTAEVICWILMVCFFYDGVYKIANWDRFGIYIGHAPYLKGFGQQLKFLIPLLEIGVAVSLMVTRSRIIALYFSVLFNICFVIWVVAVFLANHYVFFAFHVYWGDQTWMEKMLISLGLSWLSFMAIIFLGKNILPGPQKRTALIRD